MDRLSEGLTNEGLLDDGLYGMVVVSKTGCAYEHALFRSPLERGGLADICIQSAGSPQARK